MNAAPRDQAMDEFIPTRNSLLSRMRDWDDYESWREFFDTYWRFLYGIALRCGLSNEDARDVVQETVLATALDHLHRHGLVHRDVKPSNIIFVDGIPKLADIGLVARAEATLSMVGTEGYVPPEGPGTPQADLFSLGKVLYEMATGRDRQQYPELPTHLAEQGPTEMARMTELNEIILRACQPDPRQRYQSAAELHADLALLQSGRSVTQIRAMERRLRRVARAGALITLIAALAGLAFLVEQLTLPVPFDTASTANQSRLMGQAAPGTPVSLADGSVQIFDPDLRALAEFSPDDHTAELLPLASARQANRWAVGGYEPGATLPTGMFLVEVQGDSTRRIPLEHPGPISEVTFTHDDRHLLTCGADRRVRFWRTSDGRLERTVEVPPASMGQVGTLSSDGRTALWWEMSAQDSSLERRHLRFLDLESGAVIGDPVSFPAFNAVFSPDGSQLALMSSLGPVWVLESRTGRILSKGIAHSSNLRWVQWASDGRRLLTSGHDDQVLVWDPQTGAQLHGPLRSPGGAVHFARWSQDGRFIVTRNDDRQVRVWDADWAEPVTPRLAQPGHVPWAIMTGDRRVMMAIHPDQLRVMPLRESTLSPDVLADYAQLAAGRQLSDTGALLVLPPARLAALARSLRQRAPDLFQ